jgi:hypothetical protein
VVLTTLAHKSFSFLGFMDKKSKTRCKFLLLMNRTRIVIVAVLLILLLAIIVAAIVVAVQNARASHSRSNSTSDTDIGTATTASETGSGVSAAVVKVPMATLVTDGPLQDIFFRPVVTASANEHAQSAKLDPLGTIPTSPLRLHISRLTLDL